jgi:hypothetical protein
MCVNEKQDLLKLFQEWGEKEIKENGRGDKIQL